MLVGLSGVNEFAVHRAAKSNHPVLGVGRGRQVPRRCGDLLRVALAVVGEDDKAQIELNHVRVLAQVAIQATDKHVVLQVERRERDREAVLPGRDCGGVRGPSFKLALCVISLHQMCQALVEL